MAFSCTGIITALITPFCDGVIDDAALRRLIERQIAAGVHGLCVGGTTGEAAALDDTQMDRIYRIALETAAGRVPVIAGCGSNDTAHAVRLAHLAQVAGADAALVVTPYYNRPTQEGVFRHYAAIHDSCALPLILYNVPGRTALNMDMDTQTRLVALPRVVGIKDAGGDIARIARTRLSCGPCFLQYTGEDAFMLPALIQGAHGVISVVSNIAPELCVRLFDAVQANENATARRLSEDLLPLIDALFCETSPGPAKYAGARIKICRNELRLPLVPVAWESERRIDGALAALGLVEPARACA
ncbi:MAG: 4-hydroxy-tetrahydrodipicolinate synthase [Rhodospirillales bacterium]|nr:4-hydroxy-tetrahydrodipicolinate synthase [Alphaproteobacteria bacterium]MCB9986223.1 4-hydroxy-tetrahydrodipicolinate synthase [Rhodospirillales bacterium]USO07221.1 MAG: 4-hydroxy-tetrahydrodipicolinate synthase [Rhodospirillales bacterium]